MNSFPGGADGHDRLADITEPDFARSRIWVRAVQYLLYHEASTETKAHVTAVTSVQMFAMLLFWVNDGDRVKKKNQNKSERFDVSDFRMPEQMIHHLKYTGWITGYSC